LTSRSRPDNIERSRPRASWAAISLLVPAVLSFLACTSEPPPSPRGVEAITAAPNELVRLVAKFVAPTPPGPNACEISSQTAPGAQDNSVALQDVGGSGAFAFSPVALTFNAGEAANFTLRAETEFHTFTVDDVNLAVDNKLCTLDVGVGIGETEIFSFTFNKPGTYQLYCVPHLSQGMVGTIIVE
jgi:plastocyanin